MNTIIDVAPIEEMLTMEITPESLAKKMDNVIFRDGQYMLRDSNYCGYEGSEQAEELYWLRELRERLMQIWERQNANR